MARILIAEDEPLTQDLYKRLLLLNAHTTACVASGEELIEKIDEFNPDLVILDVGLPGASGIDTCRSIRQRTGFENLPIMIISAKDGEADITTGIRAGANDYLLKPVRKDELLAKVELLLEHRGAFSADPTVGGMFAGRYRLIRALGTGGNSEVHLALDTHFQREVALKIFKTTEKEENFLPRFLREAYGLSRLNHPNIVKLVDFGNQRNVFYLATEFVKGKSLGEIIKDSVLVEESAVMLALEIGKAFTYMNEYGVVHRDIKPDNILIADTGEVVLVDFGLAREEHQQTLSLKDEMFGTPQFLSPEYINGSKNIDIRTDIYSLGITLFYSVSGQFPFVGRTAMAILHQQLNEQPPYLKNMIPELSQEFADIIYRMMAKDPDARCSLAEMIQSFTALAYPESAQAAAVEEEPAPVSTETPTTPIPMPGSSRNQTPTSSGETP
jgi:serine/threonine protein kinase/ActR/RegA family two-component response regulator